MPSLKTIVCLANSRKHGERCIAGIDLETGRWVRPVSGLDDGRVPRARQLVNGRDVQLLDLVRLPLAETGPDFSFEGENLSLLPGAWSVVGRAEPRELLRYCSTAAVILQTAGNSIPLSHLTSQPPDRRCTLELVETLEFTVMNAGPSPAGGSKWDGMLRTAAGARLRARITDPKYTARLESGHQPAEHCLLTVSLGMPYRPPDRPEDEEPACWKLIAGVIELERPSASHESSGRAVPASTPGFRGPDPPYPVPLDQETLQNALKKVFGFDSFRDHQEEIVRAILGGRDVFVVMPTGSGKSLCYQLPAHLLDGCCVVVSPLISLMKDQVDAARGNGLRAARVNSGQSGAERIAALKAVSQNRLDLLYVAPERLAMDSFLTHLKKCRLSLIAIDEAHCISEWGHDFRPDYLQLSKLKEHFPRNTMAAFTATATEEVEEDTIRKLGLREPFQVRASFDRPNLLYRVVPRTDLDAQLLSFLRSHQGESGIIYRTARKSVEATAELLAGHGFRVLPYHAGLADAERERNQERFNRDEVDVIVATIAFGMGIDKPNIRYVLHGDLPKNIESFYQETGRAGRDGLPAECVLFFSAGDTRKLKFFVDQIGDDEQRGIAWRKLRAMVNFAEFNRCRRAQLLAYFSEEYGYGNCGGCDVCLSPSEEIDATADAWLLTETVFSTRQRFGAGQIVDIVRGAGTKKIRQFRHDALPVYGAGRDKAKEHWRQLIGELVCGRYLAVPEGPYPILQLSEKGHALRKKKERFHFLKRAVTSPVQRPVTPLEFDNRLVERLRQLRSRMASREGVPSYVVFSDRSLIEMARQKPATPEEMLNIHGVGEVKLSKYGTEFLEAIRSRDAGGVVQIDAPDGLDLSRRQGAKTQEKAPKVREDNSATDREKAYTVEATRRVFKNAYRPWTEDEDRLLKKKYLGGCELADLALFFGRNAGAMRSRLKKLGLM